MPIYLQDPEFVGKHMLNMAAEIKDLRSRLAQFEVNIYAAASGPLHDISCQILTHTIVSPCRQPHSRQVVPRKAM